MLFNTFSVDLRTTVATTATASTRVTRNLMYLLEMLDVKLLNDEPGATVVAPVAAVPQVNVVRCNMQAALIGTGKPRAANVAARCNLIRELSNCCNVLCYTEVYFANIGV